VRKGFGRSARDAATAVPATSILCVVTTATVASGGALECDPARADVRVAVVAKRASGGSAPTAEVRVGLARRVDSGWREVGERRLDEAYFWRTVSGPGALCRLAIGTTGARPSLRPYLILQLLLSPSLGCGRTYRIALPG
jgi:hypothetical protein